MDYVQKYLSLDERATVAESKAEEYRSRADTNRWEQCRIAHEAIDSGEHSRTSFAKAVRRHPSHIGKQYDMWAQWGTVGPNSRPAHGEAYESVYGGPPAAESQRRDLHGARKVLADPALARQLLAGSAVARSVVADALDDVERTTPTRSQRKPTTDANTEFLAAEVDLQRAMGRLVEHANAARRSGVVTPSHLREVAGEMRMYADALEAIADSRGLTDEVLAEWVGEQ